MTELPEARITGAREERAHPGRWVVTIRCPFCHREHVHRGVLGATVARCTPKGHRTPPLYQLTDPGGLLPTQPAA